MPSHGKAHVSAADSRGLPRSLPRYATKVLKNVHPWDLKGLQFAGVHMPGTITKLGSNCLTPRGRTRTTLRLDSLGTTAVPRPVQGANTVSCYTSHTHISTKERRRQLQLTGLSRWGLEEDKMNMAGYVFFPTRESRIANRGGVGGGEGGYSIGDMY